jgi:hypothetical protein
MIKLFEVNDQGLPEISVEARTIQVFKKLITRDKGSEGDHDGRKKYQATKELAFIYFYAKFDSPYEAYEEYDRALKIKKAVGLDEKWKIDKDILEAVDYFKEIQRTPAMEYLESVEIAVKNMSDYLKNTKIDQTIQEGPNKGKLVHDVGQYRSLTKEMPDLIISYQKTKELVRKEIQEEMATRAARKINKYNK